MHISHIAFYAMLLFLIGGGVFLYSEHVWLAFWIAIVAGAALCIAGWRTRNKKLVIIGLLCVCAIFGSLYSMRYTRRAQQAFSVPFEKMVTVRARIADDPSFRISTSEVAIELLPPYEGNVLLVLHKYSALRYGDVIEMRATIVPPYPEGYANYLAKDAIYGITRYPKEMKVIGWRGSKIKSMLFSLKHSFEENINRALPAREAAFMNGILLGERAEFSPEFKERMKLSGTTHLVALSGYNISIIASSVASFFAVVGLGKRWTFWISLAVIIGFVVMTGAQASVVRAAIMGALLLAGGYIERIHTMRNAIMFAAIVMVVANPYVLRYDAGFQLSFLALLGIVYLVPSIMAALRIRHDRSFLSWKGHALSTFGAQIFVMPVLLNNFHAFSPVSFFTNIAVLEIIPITMFFGFVLGIFGYLSSLAMGLIGWIVYIPLAYVTRLITFAGGLDVSFTLEHMHIILVVGYYLGLGWFIKKYYPKPVMAGINSRERS